MVRRKSTIVCVGCVLTIVGAGAPVAEFPKDKVLTFLTDSIEWYRRLPTPQRIGIDPADVVFIEDNRPITTEAVRLSFEFAKAAAALDAQNSSGVKAKAVAPTESGLKFLSTAKAKIDANIQQSQEQLRSSLAAKPKDFKDMKRLQDERADLARRIQILSSISTYYKNLLASAPTTGEQPGPQANMAALVDSLEHSLPEIAAPGGAQVASATGADGTRAANGIVRMIGRVS